MIPVFLELNLSAYFLGGEHTNADPYMKEFATCLQQFTYPGDAMFTRTDS